VIWHLPMEPSESASYAGIAKVLVSSSSSVHAQRAVAAASQTCSNDWVGPVRARLIDDRVRCGSLWWHSLHVAPALHTTRDVLG
jgi:hypothetical protein